MGLFYCETSVKNVESIPKKFKLSEIEQTRTDLKLDKFKKQTLKILGKGSYCDIKLMENTSVKLIAVMESGYENGPHYLDELIIDKNSLSIKMKKEKILNKRR